MSKQNFRKKISITDQIKHLCLSLYASGNRLEDEFWEKKILQIIQKNFSIKKQKILNKTLTVLQKENVHAYASLMELIESSTQTFNISFEKNKEESFQTILIAAPILVWTTHQIPSGTITKELTKKIHHAFSSYILSENGKTIFYQHIFASEELPENHSNVFEVTKRLSKALIQNKHTIKTKQKITPESNVYIDIRYLIGLIAVPANEALFRWQTVNVHGNYYTQTECLANWQNAIHTILLEYFSDCSFKALLPNAFYAACREANEEIRSHTITHAINYLANTLQIERNNLRAIIGGFGEKNIEEFRISLTKKGDNKYIYHGIIWPIYPHEMLETEEQLDYATESELNNIKKILITAGIKDIRHHPNFFQITFLEENQIPLFPNGFGELRPAELPIRQENILKALH